MRFYWTIFGLVLLAGCASRPPVIHKFKSLEDYPVPDQRVWEVVVKLFDEFEWPIEKNEETRGIIASEWVRDDLGGGDYGQSGFSSVILSDTKQMVVNIKVKMQSKNLTRVRVHCFFRVKWSVGNREAWGTGTSRGVVEKKILDSIHKRF